MRAGALIAAVVAVSVCSCGIGKETEAIPVPPTSTVPSKLAPPDQTVEPGKERVPFDPCLEIDDDTLRRIGLDPETRARRDRFTEVALLGCRVEGPTRLATLMATNSPFENEWSIAKSRAELIDVNGREAFIGPNAYNKDGCTLVMRTTFGEVVVDTSNLVPGFRPPLPPACDGVLEMARNIERQLPKEF